MTLAEQLDDTPRRSTGLPCSVGALEDRLSGDEAAAFASMLYELRWSGTKIHAALKAEGYEVGQQTINRHRSSSCRCFQ